MEGRSSVSSGWSSPQSLQQSQWRNLAEKYDQLWSGSESSSSSSSNSTVHKNFVSLRNSKWKAFHLHTESVVEDPDVKCGNINLDFECLGPDKEIGKTDKINGTITDGNRKSNGFKLGSIAVGDFPGCSLEHEATWSELRFQVMKLIEENLQQQAELIKRNDENRETIKELRFELERSKSENRALQSCLRCSKVDVKHNQSHISKLKGLILSKFFREGSA